MKSIVHGVLRLWVALTGVYTLYMYVSVIRGYGVSIFRGGAILSAFGGVMLITLLAVIYMSANSAREFMRKPIKLRLLYVITALLTLFSLLSVTVRLNSAYARRPLHISDMISYLTVTLMLYFTVVDFIELFIKKREKKLYTDSDFETADAES